MLSCDATQCPLCNRTHEVAVALIWTGGRDVSEDVFIMRAFVVVSVCIWASTVFGTSGRQRVHPVLDSSR